MLTALLRLLRRLRDSASRRPKWRARSDAFIARLRSGGATIGQACTIFTEEFPLELYLVEIGDRVAIAGGTVFLTHDGAAWLLRRTRPDAQHFGQIIIGSDTFIGQQSIILPGARIGSNCIVGAGSVVRGTIPDNAVALGNPATVVGRTGLLLELMNASSDTLDSFSLSVDDRERLVRAHFGRS